MGRNKTVFATAIAAVTLVTLVSCGPPRRAVTGWVPYWRTDSGRTTIDTARDLLSEVSPFWYRATSATTLADDEAASDQAAVVAQARAAHLPLIPAVRDGLPAHGMAAVLADPAQRAAHVNALVNLAVANGFAGIDLDYEQFAFADGTASWGTTRPLWVQFISELGPALHARAKLLTVTSPPIYNGARASGSGYWVYDWAGIAPFVDRLRIMAYEFSSSSPGPMAPLWWVRQIVAHAVSVVPPSKVQIGVPAYGRDFVVRVTGTCPSGVNPARSDVINVNAAALIQAKGATPVRDAASGEMTFSYVDTFTGPAAAAGAAGAAAVGSDPGGTEPVTAEPAAPNGVESPADMGPPTGVEASAGDEAPADAAAKTTTTRPRNTTTTVPRTTTTTSTTAPPGQVTCQVSRTVWYPDVESMMGKARLVGTYGISGLAQWALGFEDPAQWQPLRDYAASLPHPGGADPVGGVEVVVPAPGGQVIVGGWAFDPESDLPIQLAITTGAGRSVVLANGNRPDVASAYPGVGPYHGFGYPVAAVRGRQSVCVEALGIGSGAASKSLGCTTVTVG